MINWLRKLFKKKTYVVPPFYPYVKPRRILKRARRYKEMKPPAFHGAGGTWVYPDSWYESFWQELKDKEGWTDKELKQGWRWKKL